MPNCHLCGGKGDSVAWLLQHDCRQCSCLTTDFCDLSEGCMKRQNPSGRDKDVTT